jgi:hypothetical protein
MAALIAGTAMILTHDSGATAQDDPANKKPAGGYPAVETRPVPGNRYGANILGAQFTPDSNSQKTQELLSRYNQTQDDGERAKIVKELEAVSAQEFDARQESREKQLQQLEDQLKKLRALHARRAKEKEEIVRDRVRQLLRDADGLGWGSDGGLGDPVIVAPRNSVAVPVQPVGAAPPIGAPFGAQPGTVPAAGGRKPSE